MRTFLFLLLCGAGVLMSFPARVFADVATTPNGGGQTTTQGSTQSGQSAPNYACRFTCAPSATPTAAGSIGNVRVPCTGPNDSTTCAQACQTRCATAGPSGNGLSVTEGTGRVCSQAAQPSCVAVSATPTGGGTGSVPLNSGQQAVSSTYDLPNPIGTTDVPVLFGRIVRAFLGVLGALALFWFVWGGILWMTAEESKRAEQARSIMKNATLGLVIIFFSYGFTTLFLSLFQEVAAPATPQQGRTIGGSSPITGTR